MTTPESEVVVAANENEPAPLRDPPEPALLPVPESTESFWLSDLSKILLNHQTTSQPPTRVDVAIVGSGISGAFAARTFYEDEHGRLLNLVMFEAREVCYGASGRNGGHCQPLLYTKPPPIAAFEAKNYEFVRDLIESEEVSCEWQARPAIHAYYSQLELSQALAGIEALRTTHPELAKYCQVVTPSSTILSLEELRIPDANAAVVNYLAASLWPYKLVAWILETLLAGYASRESGKRGLFNLQTNTPVTHVWQLPTGDWALRTPRGVSVAKHCILATNGYTSHICPSYSDLIVRVRGEITAMSPSTPVVERPLEASYGFLGTEGKSGDSDYLMQRPNSQGGQLMFGGARFLEPDLGVRQSDDSLHDEEAESYLKHELPKLMDLEVPQGAGLRVTHQWTGILGYSRDGKPWVGAMPGSPRAWICAGFTGHGMSQASLCAKALAEMVLRSGFEDKRLWQVQRDLVKRGEIPEELISTSERVRAARELPQVVDQSKTKTAVEGEMSVPGEEPFTSTTDMSVLGKDSFGLTSETKNPSIESFVPMTDLSRLSGREIIV